MDKKDYGSTLNLPKTGFKMKANLPHKEPEILKYWENEKIYEKSLEGKELEFILHDGPPYANGNIHIGHALNKILKDIILKYKRLRGYKAPYVPGWDTHGLPIELQVTKKLGSKVKDMSELEIRDKCKDHALKFVDKQKEDFKRLGVLGEWDDPYLTLNPKFEAKQLEVFADLYENNYIFKGLKPIHWCPSCQTALAEAEIEYQDIGSPSIYVKFEVKDDLNSKFNLGLSEDEKVSVVIWTTTPWTLPGNIAISIHPRFEYVFVKTSKGILILAKGMLEQSMAEMEISDYEIIKEVIGSELEYVKCAHPFLGRDSLVILGEHVTLEAGTGCVHTAPGHGQDDYVVGTKYKLPIISPITNKGVLTEDAGEFAGLYYSKANVAIIEHLEKTGHLLKTKEIEHSYPHCWRCKNPVIFRATEQWFVKVEDSDLREKALKALDDVEFIPEWGRNRITSMVEGRPDWCISRQRIWGVPIPAFYCESCNEEIVSKETVLKVAEKVKEEGTNAWIKYTPEELLGDLAKCPKCGGTHLRKESNIMDVWFDSGSSHRAVLEVRDNLKWPADLYLEGSDQHRGWFQTSLLTSVGTKGAAPYKKVLTHGFVNDGKGLKMSKSTGNVVAPQEIINKYGSDILRLWCASVDYRDDVRISDNILKQMAESYRRIRNTARYILGNINDFEPSTDKVEYSNMPEIDKWALNKLERLKRKVTENYEKYEFYNLFYDIHYFASVYMSSFYLDILKDRLYVSSKNSEARRAAQTVMFEILTTLTKLISPVLTFTAEEIWKILPENLKEKESILLEDWITENDIYLNDELDEKWEKLIELRGSVNKVLEAARRDKVIGHSLNAEVILYSDDEKYKELLKENYDRLEDIFIVSKVTIVESKIEGMTKTEEIENLYVKADKAPGEKCERCWKYSEELGKDEEHPTLCPRCTDVINEG
ncbi:isoleucine--tRNA ligase [Haliovirga abyssi]|uniref:Isoleucine--tRNA ligase n=1 Tax=Haliovirga abyssi TaxID=2996794 RepID=A0AAU9DKC1_9FUSO|nr:isoleucine--tRNA ligase [Haliovirga abyssi]BDU50337.1 isoleucine--tRNA ligase [Haliovirga abyssi]